MKTTIILSFMFCVLAATAQDFSTLTPKPRQAYIRQQYSAVFSMETKKTIFLEPDNPDYIHAWEFNRELRQRGIDTFNIAEWKGAYNDFFGIALGKSGTFVNKLLEITPDQKLQITPEYPGREGYIIDVMPSRAIIAGSDDAGTHYGIVTFFQMIDKSNWLFACRIVDAPEFPVRWFYYPMNFLVGANINKLKNIWTEAASLKLNGACVGDVKYSRIHNIEQRYIDSLVSVTKFAKEKYIEFVPMVMSWGYSNILMFFNPNYASGLPVRDQRFEIDGDTARLAPEVKVGLTNGGFENYNGNNFPGFSFIDYPGQMSFVDTIEKHSGKASVRLQDFRKYSPDYGNARVHLSIKVKPFSYYHVSGWVKTENITYNDDIKIQALNKNGKGLSFIKLNIPSTSNGWKKYDICVNSLQSDIINFYWGVWEANSGKIWWDDLMIEEIPFVNMIRRAGAPIEVKNTRTGEIYSEGVDFDSLYDPKLGRAASWLGEFDTYHQPPTFRTKKNNRIKSGDTISISYYNTTTIYDGQAMVTMSDPALYDEIEREFRILDSLVKPKTYFMSHDEIRIMNWDKGDQDRNMTPGQILADNTIKCVEMIHKYSPEADIWDWSDMFDEYHNAKEKDYYLVNGDLRGSADLIPKSIGIANWNSTGHTNSLDFFADKGFRQISAPYYDAGVANIRIWKEWTQNTPNFKGMMYTTWANNYSDLKGFAEYAWNHAPYVYHQPPWANKPEGALTFDMKIEGDKMDNNWQAKDVILHYRTSPADEFSESTEMPITEDVQFKIDMPTGNKWFQYYITATDNKGWVTRIPFGEGHYYELGEAPVGVDEIHERSMCIYPNPVVAGKSIFLNLPKAPVSIKIYNIRGELISSISNVENSQRIQIGTENIMQGIYFIKINYIHNAIVIKQIIK